MNEAELKVLQGISAALGSSAEFVIAQYAAWFVWSAALCTIFGLFVCYVAWKWDINADRYADYEPIVLTVARAVVVFVGAAFILANAPDIAQPKAAAIHQIFKDVRAK